VTAPASTQPPPPTTFPSVPQTFLASIVGGSGSFNLPATTAGLAGLASYQATLTLAFDGTSKGQPSTWTKTYVIVATKSPAASQITLTKTGALANLDATLHAEAAGVGYDKTGKKTCAANALAADAVGKHQLEPAQLLSSLAGATPAGSETIDGTPATHVTFDQLAIGLGNQAESTGEAWIATTGGYLVKYTLTTTAKADYFGDGVEGKLTWSYALTGINKTVVPALPPECPTGLLDVPRLPDAANIDSGPGMLSYTTASKLSDIAAFYAKELPKAGWKQTNTATLTDPSTALDFTKGAASLTVAISTEAGVTTVTIVAGDNQP
jgi:hypothetical protein